MQECLLDVDGQPIFIRGYASVFNLPSWPMGRNDGCCEIVKPWAFDAILRRPSASLNIQFHHAGLEFIAGSLALDTLQVWADDFGLAFEAGPYNICGRNVTLLRPIADGEIRGASWSGWLASARFEIVDGERVKVIRRFKTLDHISPVNEPAYPDTGIWLSSERRDDLPPRLRALSDIWAAHRPTYDTGRALRKMARAVSRLPRRPAASGKAPPRPQARAGKKLRAPVRLAIDDIFLAGFGLSTAELDEGAFRAAAARRMRKWSRRAA